MTTNMILHIYLRVEDEGLLLLERRTGVVNGVVARPRDDVDGKRSSLARPRSQALRNGVPVFDDVTVFVFD